MELLLEKSMDRKPDCHNPWSDKELDMTGSIHKAMVYDANINICVYTCTLKTFSEGKMLKIIFFQIKL